MSLRKYVKQIAFLSPRATVLEASKAMLTKGIGAILVMSDDGKAIGILTDRDVVTRVVAQGKDPTTTPIEAVMSGQVHCLREDAPFREVTRLVGEKGVRRIPILDESGRVTGLVTLDDLIVEMGIEIGNLAQGIVAGLVRSADVEAAAWQEPG